MIIKYTPLPNIKSKVVLVPLVPITLIYGKYEISQLALVDSGASGAVISTTIAEDMHINWRKLPVSLGFSVGSSFRSHRFNKLQIEIANHNFQLSVSIVEGIAPHRCILGQADIFQRAKITFEGYKKQFEIIFIDYN